MGDLDKIQKEQKNLAILYEQSNSLLDFEVLQKSRELDCLIVSYLKKQNLNMKTSSVI